MKQAAIVIAMLGISAWSLGQSNDKPASRNAQTAPASGQAAPAAQGKRPPQAKTQPEFEAYNAAVALTDPAALEKAADDFATKFPDSELRVLLYKAAMQKYRQANNGDKMVDVARKALTYDPDDPDALLGVALVLAERTRETDLDKDQRLAEAKKDAERAMVTVDTDIPTSGLTQERIDAYKSSVRSDAYYILGLISYNAKAWADAETNLRKSIDANPQQVDPFTVFQLGVALDMQGKYAEALKYCNQAVDLTKEDTATGKAARQERDRLMKLTGAAAPAQTPAPPK